MPVPRSIIPVYLRLTRANAPFVSVEGAQRRIRERALRPRAWGPPRHLRADVRIQVRQDEGWPVYRVLPSTGAPEGSVLYLHGGGWVHEIAKQHWQLIAQIAAEARTTVVVPIYPLVPHGTAGAVHEQVVRIALRSIDESGTVSLAGDSAGGQIALSAALTLRVRGEVLPHTVLIAPALDLAFGNPRIPAVQRSDPWLGVPGGRELAAQWAGTLAIHDPMVSPMFGDLTGLGPITVFSGTRDVLNPDAHLLVEKARDAGVEMTFHERQGEVHVYPLLPTRSGAAARRMIVDTLRR